MRSLLRALGLDNVGQTVTLVHARLGSWSLRLHVHYHYTSSATLNRDKLEAEAEIAPRDVAVLLKPRRDTLNSSRRESRPASRAAARVPSAAMLLPHHQ